jgi:hypothetical protein
MPVNLATQDQEEHGSKPAQAEKVHKILHKNRADGVAQGEGPEFKPQYHQKKTVIQQINDT